MWVVSVCSFVTLFFMEFLRYSRVHKFGFLFLSGVSLDSSGSKNLCAARFRAVM